MIAAGVTGKTFRQMMRKTTAEALSYVSRMDFGWINNIRSRLPTRNSSTVSIKPEPKQWISGMRKASHGNPKEKAMDFCAKMTGHLLIRDIEDGCRKNMVLSPLSFNAVLNMVAAGSTGLTLNQMSKFLEFNNLDHINSKFLDLMSVAASSSSSTSTDDHNNTNGNHGGGPVICLANGVWVDKQYPLKPSYQQLVDSVYKAQAKNVDFVNQADEVVEIVNAWAKSATKGLVTDILTPDDIAPATILILGTALYFKGSWEEKFKAEKTENRDFYLLNGDTVSVPFMTGCKTYTYGSYEGFEVVSIPYQRGKQDGKVFSMFIFLPNERDGLHNLLEQTTLDSGFFTQDFQLKYRRFNTFWIPKFKFAFRTSKGRQTMKDMGLNLPFMEDCKELTGFVDTNGLPFYVSEIVQKAFIEVDEVGTEAASVACHYVGNSRVRTGFVADHPFMFMIREESSRSVLFTGAVLNPLLQD